MVDRPSGEKPTSFLRPIIDDEALPVRKTIGQHKPAVEDLTSPLAPPKPTVMEIVCLKNYMITNNI